ncbi:hypothetical protein T4D_3632 [Trichinella pseudospiralis]|uniref:Uncharacterized protein n=1 Tax=Trichinella pseudospiralis TaxID=6337 RepID=A0A0V1FMP1_TRIPS|nr:hypothetical protein T4D_3632 [Trichinella pseudospiralis]
MNDARVVVVQDFCVCCLQNKAIYKNIPLNAAPLNDVLSSCHVSQFSLKFVTAEFLKNSIINITQIMDPDDEQRSKAKRADVQETHATQLPHKKLFRFSLTDQERQAGYACI